MTAIFKIIIPSCCMRKVPILSLVNQDTESPHLSPQLQSLKSTIRRSSFDFIEGNLLPLLRRKTLVLPSCPCIWNQRSVVRVKGLQLIVAILHWIVLFLLICKLRTCAGEGTIGGTAGWWCWTEGTIGGTAWCWTKGTIGVTLTRRRGGLVNNSLISSELSVFPTDQTVYQTGLVWSDWSGLIRISAV